MTCPQERGRHGGAKRGRCWSTGGGSRVFRKSCGEPRLTSNPDACRAVGRPMSEPREARLRPEFAPLYPGVPPETWMPAREMNQLVGVARLGWTGHPEDLVRSRMLDRRHFEFRGGSVRPPSQTARAMDTEPRERVGWWAAGIARKGSVRQTCLRHEHAARYPLIPPGLWLPAKPIAGLVAARAREPGHPAGRRTLDPAHFQFRGGGGQPRATSLRATDPNSSSNGEAEVDDDGSS
jgi:hypothetical protein